MTRRESPLVSIVVPSLRQGLFLTTCLESLLAQTYPSVEILVYDSCSDDETPEILSRYRARLQRVVVESDSGQAAALRRGFAEARGDILGWLNADDMLMPDAVANAVSALESPATPDVVYGHCAQLDADGRFLGYFHHIADYDAHALRNHSDFIPQPSAFFRRSAYEAVGGLDASLSYAMDWDLWCRMARAGLRFRFLPLVLSGMRVHSAAKTVRGGWRRLAEVWRVNWRHKTRPLPMLMVLYLGHVMMKASGLRDIARLDRARRSLRHWAVGTDSSGAVVCGVALGPRVVEPHARIVLPVYGRLSGVRVAFGEAGVEADVSVDGRRAEHDVDGVWIATLSEPAWRTHVCVDLILRSPPPHPILVEPLVAR